MSTPSRITRVVLAAAALALLVYMAMSADWPAIFTVFSERRHQLVWILLPFAGIAAVDTFCWQSILAALNSKGDYPSLLRIRLFADAVINSAPAGGLVAELGKPHLLKRHLGTPLTIGAISLFSRHFFIVLIHGAQLLLALLFAHELFTRTGDRLQIPFIAELTLMMAIALVTIALLERRVGLSLARNEDSWLSRRLVKSDTLKNAGADIANIFELPLKKKAELGAGFAIVGALEVVECWVIAHCVGIDLGFAEAAGVEAAAILLRVLIPAAPAGVGVQEATYAGLLMSLESPASAGAVGAFTLSKRLRELIFIGIGAIAYARLEPLEAKA